jgi:hypothetical protein
MPTTEDKLQVRRVAAPDLDPSWRAKAINWLLNWGFGVEVGKLGDEMRIISVSGHSIVHRVYRDEAMKIGEITYYGQDNQIWYKGPASATPTEAIAARIGHYVLNKIANDKVQLRLTDEEEAIRTQFLDKNHNLIVSRNRERLVIKISNGKTAPNPEASRVIIRKIQRLVKHFNRVRS